MTGCWLVGVTCWVRDQTHDECGTLDGAMSSDELFAQAIDILQTRYGFPESEMQTLAMLASVETAKVAALSMVERCRCRTASERQDCLVLLEVCARELGGR